MKKLFFLMGALCVGSVAQSQNEPAAQSTKDTTKIVDLEAVTVQAVRVKKTSPVTFSNVTKNQIKNRNLGQDIPILLNYLPNVVTTSDAGAGVGYTGIRVRGSDPERMNVTINGVPLNDSESQGVYWVNMPDLVSSVESLQLQRGLGTSTNGAGAFGSSLNLLTDAKTSNAFAEISNSFGSYNTLKHTIKLGTGKINEHFEIAGRVSKITSDGYRDRAFSDMKSYFLQGIYSDKNTLIKALIFGGKQKTYQAWYSVKQKEIDKYGRTYNPAGMYVDANGNTKFYDGQTDNYQQDFYQLHWSQKIDESWNSQVAIYYTKGKGFYEEYANWGHDDYPIYDLSGNDITYKDHIHELWLDNDFYGVTASANYHKDLWDVVFGGGTNLYKGWHFGKLLWSSEPTKIDYNSEFYRNVASKNEGNLYAKATYRVSPNWEIFGDIQYRYINYDAEIMNAKIPVEKKYNFINPKAGITYILNSNNNLYFSYAKGSREPIRSDFKENMDVKPETLNDFELGWRYLSNKLKVNANAYYMLYKDQLVLTGRINSVGASIRENVGRSYRAGIELDAILYLSKKWQVRPNISISSNKNIDYTHKDSSGNFVNLGNTNISFSPNIVAGNLITFLPKDNIQVSLLSKYIGKQYLSNLDIEEHLLKDYFINDLNFGWQIDSKKVFKSLELSLLVNNIFSVDYRDAKLSSSGSVKYFPRAPRNFLLGATFKF